MTECQRLTESGFISESFLKEETRDEYLISADMKKVWAIELDLLHEFIRICRENKLQYWVGFGTLLGTIRHKGFIPWDDDLDVWMPREDYEKLLSIPANQIDEPYFLQTTLNDTDYYSAFARLRNSNTTGILVSKNNRCNNGIYIDIYPMDGMEDSLIRQKIKATYIHIKNVIAHAYLYNINPSPITRLINKVMHLSFIRYDYHKTYKKVNKLAASKEWYQAHKVGIVVFNPYSFGKIYYDKDGFSETLSMPFENMTVNVPKGYDKILGILYGNYMEFPPVDKRGNWHSFTFLPDIPYTEFVGKGTKSN